MIMFIPVPIKAKYLIGGYVLMDLYAALTGNNIIGPANTAHWAHIGGALIGFIIIWYWKKNSFNNNKQANYCKRNRFCIVSFIGNVWSLI